MLISYAFSFACHDLGSTELWYGKQLDSVEKKAQNFVSTKTNLSIQNLLIMKQINIIPCLFFYSALLCNLCFGSENKSFSKSQTRNLSQTKFLQLRVWEYNGLSSDFPNNLQNQNFSKHEFTSKLWKFLLINHIISVFNKQTESTPQAAHNREGERK